MVEGFKPVVQLVASGNRHRKTFSNISWEHKKTKYKKNPFLPKEVADKELWIWAVTLEVQEKFFKMYERKQFFAANGILGRMHDDRAQLIDHWYQIEQIQLVLDWNSPQWAAFSVKMTTVPSALKKPCYCSI